MLLQSGQAQGLGAEQLNSILSNGSGSIGSGSSGGSSGISAISGCSSSGTGQNVVISQSGEECQLDVIASQLKEGWTVHTAKEGRLYYCNHVTRTATWLPPADCWRRNEELPYGWEKAIDQKGRPYYINHLNKTTTYEAPDCYKYDEQPPEPRMVVLQRSPTMGFGFVAGSERPVIVRFVTEGGPSVNKLEPGDQILAVNGEDVKDAPRDHIIQLVRACDHQVTLLVCQPEFNSGPERKSTLLSASKKAKLRSRPNRVRFAESVCVNGAPLFPPSAFSLGDICVPPMANVLKVFLENGQTKSFKYDATTTVQDVVTSLRDKLLLTAGEHFSLVLEHVKTLKRNILTLLDPQETLARIASRPGAHKLRCLFRVTFVPVSAANLAQKDLNSLDYLYMQCCNDVVQERFAPELLPDVALRLAALQMHQHALANNISPIKLTVKTVEEFGLERFVPTALIEGMKRKELRRLISHFLKLNAQMTGSSTKTLTQLQAKIHYLDIVSGLPSYGAKCFSTNSRNNVESVLLISPRFGFSQISDVTKNMPKPISAIEDVHRVVAIREDDIFYSVSVYIQPDRIVTFSMEDRDASEFALVLAGYYRLLTGGKELLIDIEREIYVEDVAPPYLSLHSVLPSTWSYLPGSQMHSHCMAFSMPPPYHSTKKLSISSQQCDRNMNTTLSNNNHKNSVSTMDEFGFDIHSVLTMEILENTKMGGNNINGIIEARNEEVLRRVAEMQKMVESSERYLIEHGELMDEYEHTPLRTPWCQSSIEVDSDCESLASSKVSSNEDAPPPGVLKHSDSLVLLAESINHELGGITKGLNDPTNCSSANGLGKSGDTVEINHHTKRQQHGLSQILTDLQTLTNDLSQSESDSEVSTPNNSPIRMRTPNSNDKINSKMIRTSFGLHSPDSSILGADTKDMNLREYLRQLREASSNAEAEDTDLAAKKLKELYGFELTDETIIETDADLIDLRAIPPPQTPDELDAFTVLDAPPTGFGDVLATQEPGTNNSKKPNSENNLEEFLAKMIIAPPAQKITPCKELTPEEIMSFIIPPPPGLADEMHTTNTMNAIVKVETEPIVPNNEKPVVISDALIKQPLGNGHCVSIANDEEDSLYINSKNMRRNFFPLSNKFPPAIAPKPQSPPVVPVKPLPLEKPQSNHVIEYPTIERKGAFSCCTKSKKDSPTPSPSPPPLKPITCEQQPLELPPRNFQCSPIKTPPLRPPKNPDLNTRMNSTMPRSKIGNGNHVPSVYEMDNPPIIPPRLNDDLKMSPPPLVMHQPPRKPPLPPVPIKPILKSPLPSFKSPNGISYNHETSSVRVAGIGSPHFHRNPNSYRKIDRAFNHTDEPQQPLSPQSPVQISRSNGHFRSLSDCPPVCLQNPGPHQKPQLSLLCSPQMPRKVTSVPSSPQLSNKNGHVLNAESLLHKTAVAMDGLLVKLDQVAANCSAAQAAGGGNCIDEHQYQISRDHLTDNGLQLVSASKLLVVSLSDYSLSGLPENLTSCLTAFRGITELAKDLSNYTSTPLQTRNIVLKVHDVASSFRELVSVQIGPLGAGQLALQAECLANALASLLRSLRVFSP